MPLTFPTLAEQCAARFYNSSKTISIATIAKQMNAAVSYDYPITSYKFDDDTVLTVRGRGRAHTIETRLP